MPLAMDETGSLISRAMAAARTRAVAMRAWAADRPGVPAGRRDWLVAGGVAGLIAAGPVATILAAHLIAGGLRGEIARLEEQAAPRVAAEQAVAKDRATLVALLRRPGLGAEIDALARAMPPEAALSRIARGRDGLLEVDISAPDPDKLRAALRREPALARLRDAGQRQADMMMIVSLKEVRE